jgi:hypothetical protein
MESVEFIIREVMTVERADAVIAVTRERIQHDRATMQLAAA